MGIDLSTDRNTGWLERLTSCAGLASAGSVLPQNVNENGEIPTFRGFEEWQAKLKREMAALEEKEIRTEDQQLRCVD